MFIYVYIYIYIYMYMYIYMYICMCIYIYICSEREKERESAPSRPLILQHSQALQAPVQQLFQAPPFPRRALPLNT